MSSTTLALLSYRPELFEAATKHAFLQRAGNGTLSPTTLVSWLIQDEHYQHAYVRFIGKLLARLELPSSIKVGGKNDSLEHRIWDALNTGSSILRTEEAFYSKVIKDHELTSYVDEVDHAPSPSTKLYLTLFETAGEDILEGITVFWATEYTYLCAWQYARQIMRERSNDKTEATTASSPGEAESGEEQDHDGVERTARAVREQFIPNWTSDDFEKFVNGLGDLLNELVEEHVKTGKATRDACMERCRRMWLETIEAEVGFWPEV